MWFLLDKYRLLIENGAKNIDATALKNYRKSETFFDVIDSTAIMDINGVLTKEPDFIAELFGGGNTTYSDIIDFVDMANADDKVKKIILNIGYSPGGSVVGMFDAMATISGSKKPLTAHVQEGALSAAYGLVSQADEVIAAGKHTQFGSVGVVATIPVHDDDVQITSSEAPNKRPDVRTDNGKKIVQKELDDLHNLFVQAISEKRGLSGDYINKNFGRGGVVLATDAVKNKMIDGILNEPVRDNNEEMSKMDINLLKSDHPDLYKQIFELGAKDERDRVCSHLDMCADSGCYDLAVDAIRDGASLTPGLASKYAVATYKKQLEGVRLQDNPSQVPDASAAGSDPDRARVMEAVVNALEGGYRG